MNTESLLQLDRRYIWHPFTHMRQWLEGEQLVITDAQGMYLFDSDGNRYLDGVSSLWCNVHGHRVPEIDAAVAAQLNRVAHTTMLGLCSEPAILLAEQNAFLALSFADRAYVLQTGSVTLQGTGAELLSNPDVQKAYLS